MKKLIYLTFCCTLFCMGLFASECHKCALNEVERVFLAPDQIALNAQGIFVQIKDQWMSTGALHCDAGRFYVTKNDYEYRCNCEKGHPVPCQWDRCGCGAKIIRP